AWIALLHRATAAERRRLHTVHSALQQEIVTAEWSWTTRLSDAATLARTLNGRRERYRTTLVLPPPHGLGLILPRQGRAPEAFPDALLDARGALARALALLDSLADRRVDGAKLAKRAEVLRDAAYDAIGAWRLGEVEAPHAAAAIAAAIGHALDGVDTGWGG